MYKIPYLILKAKLTALTDLKLVDIDLQQERAKGGLRCAPAALIRFLPTALTSIGKRQQQGELEFEVRLLSDVSHGDDKRITNNLPVNHYELCELIYKALDGTSGKLSEAAGFTDLAGTANDSLVLGTIDRSNIADGNSYTRLMQTTQRFKCFVKITTNMKPYTPISGVGLEIESTEV